MRLFNLPQQVREEVFGDEVVTVVFKEAQVAYNTVCSSRSVEGRVLLVKQHFKQRLPIVAQGTPLDYLGRGALKMGLTD